MERLNNKVIIVTGAADGIGLAICQACSREGAFVVMTDINVKKCKTEAKNIANSVAKKCDVAITADVVQMIKEVVESYGRIDVLINNAAVAISGNIIDMLEDDWDTVYNTNLKSIFRTIKSTLPYMLIQQSGSVINMSSIQAFRSWDDWTAYAGAKGAMLSMTNQLAGQFGGQGIRFNTISPGAIMTPLNEKRIQVEGDLFFEASKNMSPISRMGTSEEVAMVAVFLASDESSFITGEDIKVDGGLSAVPRYCIK